MSQGSWGSGGGGPSGWGTPSGQPNPYTPPGFAPTPAGYPPGYTPEAAGAVAWEDSKLPVFSRWWATVRAVCFSPGAFFDAAAKNDNMGSAVSFAAMSGAIGGLFQGVYSALLSFLAAGFIASLGKTMGKDGEMIVALYGGLGIFQLVATPIQAVMLVLTFSFIFSGIHHGVLMLLRGATKSYAHSFRVVAYASASEIFQVVPLVGPFIAVIWAMVVCVAGHDATHRSGSGKALGAVLAPLLLFCCCVGLLIALGVALGAATAHR